MLVGFLCFCFFWFRTPVLVGPFFSPYHYCTNFLVDCTSLFDVFLVGCLYHCLFRYRLLSFYSFLYIIFGVFPMHTPSFVTYLLLFFSPLFDRAGSVYSINIDRLSEVGVGAPDVLIAVCKLKRLCLFVLPTANLCATANVSCCSFNLSGRSTT